MNNVQLIGNLTRDVDYGETTTGVAYAQFSVAVQRRFADTNGERQTDFIDCIAWRTLAELSHKYLSKGSKVGVVGSIQIDTYTDREGKTRKSFKVLVNSLEFLSSNSEVGGKSNKRSTNKPAQQSMEELDDTDTLPF